MGSCEIPVMITCKDVVAPSSHHQQPKHGAPRLPLSSLDYIYSDDLMVSVYLCYTAPRAQDGHEPIQVLRESLARTLAQFPTFAGEIVANPAGEPETLLSGRGVEFLHASTDLELRELDIWHPDISVRDTLVPVVRGGGALAVQATEFGCGGLVVGMTFDHRVADAYSANMFLLSWVENAVYGRCVSYVPNVERRLLCAMTSNPQAASSSVERWYVARPQANSSRVPHQPELDDPAEQFTSRTFYIEADKIRDLQQKACAETNGHKLSFKTKYEAFTAFLWQVLAKSVNKKTDTSFKMSIAVDGRTRMHDSNPKNADLMPHYFGNVVSFPFTEATASNLDRMSLAEAANLVHRCKEETATAEHFSNLIDWVEKMRPMEPAGRVYAETTEEGASVMVSSGQRFPVAKLDFGWGKPAFGSYYFPWKGEAGYVMPMPSIAREGDWVVYMHLRKKHIDVVEKEASHVFRPILSSYFTCPNSC